MKISKIFGVVLCLHLGVITMLIVQPGCRTTQPPTASESFRQDRTHSDSLIRERGTGREPIPATRSDSTLDPAFNAGYADDTSVRAAPRRPSTMESDFGDFGMPEPTLSGPSVDVTGPSTRSYTVQSGDNLWTIARRNNVPLSELYAANDMNQNSVLRVGQQIQIPVESSSATVNMVTADSYQPSGYDMETQSYTVRAGDSLSRIAHQYDTTVRAIKAANNKTSDVIRVGETLVIPVSGERGTSSTAPAPIRSTATSSAPAAPTVSVSGATRTHTVKAGEFPGAIARQYGMTTAELLALNSITDPRKLQVGQKLKVNGSGSSENIATRTETVATPPRPAERSTTAATTTTARTTAPAPSSTGVTANGAPVQIRVVEADPLMDSDAADFDTDSMFDSAVEIPVIRMDEEQ